MDDQRTKIIDERFDEVTQAFLDQRDYTTFCFDRLRQELRHEIRQSEARLAGRVDGLGGRVDGLANRLDRHELVLSEILNEVKRLSTPPPDAPAAPRGAGRG